MLVGLDKNETKEYVSPSDKENPTIFLIGNITNREKLRMTKVMHRYMKEDNSIDVNKIEEDEIYNIVKLGLRGIKNFKVGGEVKESIEVNDEVIDSLPIEVMVELVAKILEYNFPTEQERKN